MPRIVYIASPYTLGDQAENVRVQKLAAHTILDMGHCPIAPLLAHYLHIFRPRHYNDWINMCLALVPRADHLIRLPGASAGADREVALAQQHGIPVAFNWDELVLHINETKEH